MKRLRVILLFLLLGAIVNVGVAWVCATTQYRNRNPYDEIHASSIPDHGGLMLLFARSSYRTIFQLSYHPKGIDFLRIDSIESFRLVSLIPSWARHAHTLIENQDDEVFSNVIEQATGWPMLSFSQTLASSNGPSGGLFMGPTEDEIIKALAAKAFPLQYHGIPFRPIWGSLAFNTFFYATVLWLVSVCPFLILRKYRRRRWQLRGCCRSCGYDLSGTAHEACPECGEEIRKANPA